MVNEQYDRAKRILSEHKEGHNELTQLLIDKEVIFAEDVERIFGKRPWASRSEEIMAAKESQDAARAERELAQKVKKKKKKKSKKKKLKILQRSKLPLTPKLPQQVTRLQWKAKLP